MDDKKPTQMLSPADQTKASSKRNASVVMLGGKLDKKMDRRFMAKYAGPLAKFDEDSLEHVIFIRRVYKRMKMAKAEADFWKNEADTMKVKAALKTAKHNKLLYEQESQLPLLPGLIMPIVTLRSFDSSDDDDDDNGKGDDNDDLSS